MDEDDADQNVVPFTALAEMGEFSPLSHVLHFLNVLSLFRLRGVSRTFQRAVGVALSLRVLTELEFAQILHSRNLFLSKVSGSHQFHAISLDFVSRRSNSIGLEFLLRNGKGGEDLNHRYLRRMVIQYGIRRRIEPMASPVGGEEEEEEEEENLLCPGFLELVASDDLSMECISSLIWSYVNLFRYTSHAFVHQCEVAMRPDGVPKFVYIPVEGKGRMTTVNASSSSLVHLSDLDKLFVNWLHIDGIEVEEAGEDETESSSSSEFFIEEEVPNFGRFELFEKVSSGMMSQEVFLEILDLNPSYLLWIDSEIFLQLVFDFSTTEVEEFEEEEEEEEEGEEEERSARNETDETEEGKAPLLKRFLLSVFQRGVDLFQLVFRSSSSLTTEKMIVEDPTITHHQEDEMQKIETDPLLVQKFVLAMIQRGVNFEEVLSEILSEKVLKPYDGVVEEMVRLATSRNPKYADGIAEIAAVQIGAPRAVRVVVENLDETDLNKLFTCRFFALIVHGGAREFPVLSALLVKGASIQEMENASSSTPDEEEIETSPSVRFFRDAILATQFDLAEWLFENGARIDGCCFRDLDLLGMLLSSRGQLWFRENEEIARQVLRFQHASLENLATLAFLDAVHVDTDFLVPLLNAVADEFGTDSDAADDLSRFDRLCVLDRCVTICLPSIDLSHSSLSELNPVLYEMVVVQTTTSRRLDCRLDPEQIHSLLAFFLTRQRMCTELLRDYPDLGMEDEVESEEVLCHLFTLLDVCTEGESDARDSSSDRSMCQCQDGLLSRLVDPASSRLTKSAKVVCRAIFLSSLFFGRLGRTPLKDGQPWDFRLGELNSGTRPRFVRINLIAYCLGHLGSSQVEIDQFDFTLGLGRYRVPSRYTLLHVACAHGLTRFAETLLEAGANVDLFSEGPNHVAPLHLAAHGGHWSLVRILIERWHPKVSRNFENKYGEFYNGVVEM